MSVLRWCGGQSNSLPVTPTANFQDCERVTLPGKGDEVADGIELANQLTCGGEICLDTQVGPVQWGGS